MVSMPFGKHNGQPMCDIPTPYLAWVLRDCESAEWWLREAVQVELDARIHDSQPVTTRHAHPKEEAVSVGAVIKSWWREMALRHHPDRGGDTRVTQALN